MNDGRYWMKASISFNSVKSLSPQHFHSVQCNIRRRCTNQRILCNSERNGIRWRRSQSLVNYSLHQVWQRQSKVTCLSICQKTTFCYALKIVRFSHTYLRRTIKMTVIKFKIWTNITNLKVYLFDYQHQTCRKVLICVQIKKKIQVSYIYEFWVYSPMIWYKKCWMEAIHLFCW